MGLIRLLGALCFLSVTTQLRVGDFHVYNLGPGGATQLTTGDWKELLDGKVAALNAEDYKRGADAISEVQNATAAFFHGKSPAKVKKAVAALVEGVVGGLGNLGAASFEGESGDADSIPECTSEQLSRVEGVLLDLDGTMYGPDGLLPGAAEFFAYAESIDFPYILLSNGFKTREGVAAKFASKEFFVPQRIDPNRIHTAGIAFASYLTENVPKGAKIFAVGTGITYGDGSQDSLPRIIKRECPKELTDTWEIRTDLSMEEVYEWAHRTREEGQFTVVAMAFMGSPKDTFADDPVTLSSGYETLDYNLLSKMTVLLRNKALFVVGAPDIAQSAPPHCEYHTVDTSLPTMGGVESLLLTTAEMFPGSEAELKYHINTGKGGRYGKEYMMDKAIGLLRLQVPEVKRENVMILGDNFGTDILAGSEAGIMTGLVLTGVHGVESADAWAPSRPTCYMRDVGQFVEKRVAKK